MTDPMDEAVERLSAVLRGLDSRGPGPGASIDAIEADGRALLASYDGEYVRGCYIDSARTLLRTLGLVAVPRELVEAVERAKPSAHAEWCDACGEATAAELHGPCAKCFAKLDLADAILAQVRR